MAAGGRVRYRVLVRWRWWVETVGCGREVVGECATAGELMLALKEWNRTPGVARVWWEARRLDGTWRECGRAAA